MTKEWKDIDKIESVAELDFIWSELDKNCHNQFKLDVLFHAQNQANNDFMKWCKKKYNRYKYTDAKIHKNFIKWCKNLCYFTYFYISRLSVGIMATELKGGNIGQTTKNKNVVCSFFLGKNKYNFIKTTLIMYKKYIQK